MADANDSAVYAATAVVAVLVAALVVRICSAVNHSVATRDSIHPKGSLTEAVREEIVISDAAKALKTQLRLTDTSVVTVAYSKVK